jgi:hypothetical protein
MDGWMDDAAYLELDTTAITGDTHHRNTSSTPTLLLLAGGNQSNVPFELSCNRHDFDPRHISIHHFWNFCWIFSSKLLVIFLRSPNIG